MGLLKIKLNDGTYRLVKYEYVPKTYLSSSCNVCENNRDIPDIGKPSYEFVNYTFLNPGYRFFGGAPSTRILYDIPEGKRITARFSFTEVNYNAKTIIAGVEFVGCDNGIQPYQIRGKTTIRFQSTTITYDTNMSHYNGYSSNEHFFILGNNGMQYNVSITPAGTDMQIMYEDKYLTLHNFTQSTDIRIANFYEFSSDSTKFDLYYLNVYG